MLLSLCKYICRGKFRLDELTALLDLDSQLDLVPAVQRLVKNGGLTALRVTHGLDELNYCDGAFLLEKCEVVDEAIQQG
jgi:energy-coupling factor transport system ATP-binding protein